MNQLFLITLLSSSLLMMSCSPTNKKSSAVQQRTTDSQKPTVYQLETANQGSNPADKTHTPVSQSSNPTDKTPTPVSQGFKPADKTHTPVSQGFKPADKTPTPVPPTINNPDHSSSSVVSNSVTRQSILDEQSNLTSQMKEKKALMSKLSRQKFETTNKISTDTENALFWNNKARELSNQISDVYNSKVAMQRRIEDLQTQLDALEDAAKEKA